jgi:hypothetical protein
MNETPDAFLSSRIMPLTTLRTTIRDRAEECKFNVWVSELVFPNQQMDESIIVACLEKVISAHVFIALIEGSYGGTATEELGDLSLLEFEIALAALSGKPIYAFLLKARSDDPRMRGLVNNISALSNATIIEAQDEGDLLIRNILSCLTRERKAIRRKRSKLLRLVRWLDPSWTATERELDIPSERSAFMGIEPLPMDTASIDRAEKLIARAARELDTRRRLLHLWSALRHLMRYPWRGTDDTRVETAWLQFLSSWDSTTAWIGLHEQTFLNRLAAARERFALQQKRSLREGDPDRSRLLITSGGMASLLYSVGKRQSSLWAKHRVLKRALAIVDEPLSEGVGNRSGLLAIRGHILLHLGHPRRAVRDFSEGLKLRHQVCENEGRIGEAEADLGLSLLASGRITKSRVLLESGVEKLQRTGRNGFTVRAMRDLAMLEAVSFKLSDAIKTLEAGCELAEKYSIEDQAHQLRLWLSRLHWIDSLPSRMFSPFKSVNRLGK